MENIKPLENSTIKNITPLEISDPLAEDTFVEKLVWQGLIWLIYAVFTAMLIVAIIG